MCLSAVLVIHSILLNAPTVYAYVIIDTDYGLIAGSQTQSMNTFIEIPYAKPPVNELRFAPPQHVEPWSDTFMATGDYVRISCPSDERYSPVMSEDCLFLNVYTPPDAQESITNYAVLIWFHDGAFQNGYSGAWDVSSIIDYIPDVIIVSINYRLGILGSLYDNTYDTGLEGNYGYLDQKMAIEWVYHNIRYFGGDPTQIVLFGLSAGAYYVGLHLLYNNEYITGGIMQSPPFGMPSRDPTTWRNVPSVFTSSVGCGGYTDNATELLHCWRSVPWESIVPLQAYSFSNFAFFANWNVFMSFTPTVKTNLLPNQPILQFRNSSITDQIPPFIIGHTRDEGFMFMSGLKPYADYDLFYTLFEMLYGDRDVVDETFDYYGISRDSEKLYDEISKQLGDLAFDCAIRNIAQNSINNNVYFYRFNVIETRRYSQCYNKSCHTHESHYLFDSEFDINETSIGSILKIYWTNFAKYRDPNDEDIENVWEHFSANMETMTMTIDNYTAGSVAINEKYNTKCDFWDYIGYAGVYCSDCAYVPSDSLSNPGTTIETTYTDIATIATVTSTYTDIATIATVTSTYTDGDSTDKSNNNRVSGSTTGIIIIVCTCTVIAFAIFGILVWIKRKKKNSNTKQQGASLEIHLENTKNDNFEAGNGVKETLVEGN